jgi:hypothetical protein
MTDTVLQGSTAATCACGNHAWISVGVWIVLVDAARIQLLRDKRWRVVRRIDGVPSYVTTGQASGGTREVLHRSIAVAPSGKEVDHKNRNALDNRDANLRVCTHAENCRNRKRPQGRTGFTGVRFEASRQRYRAVIYVNGVRSRGPRRKTGEEAAADYARLSIDLHGDFSALRK